MKEKEIAIANYIIDNPNLLFEKSLRDIEIKRAGNVVELNLYYKPESKYEYWRLKKMASKETQFVLMKCTNGLLCVRFLAKSKYKDLILCKLYSKDTSLSEKKLYSVITEKLVKQ